MRPISSFYPGLEQEICGEIRDWSQHALEGPNEKYGSLPVCPYAKKAWEEDKVGFSFKYGPNYQPLYTLVSTFDDAYDVIILVDLAYEKDPKKFHEYLLDLNKAVSREVFIQKDIWIMGFHPEDDPNENIDDGTFEPSVDMEYAMIFIQRLSKLQESAEKLKHSGYYSRYFGDYETPHVFKLRAGFYSKLHQEAVSG